MAVVQKAFVEPCRSMHAKCINSRQNKDLPRFCQTMEDLSHPCMMCGDLFDAEIC